MNRSMMFAWHLVRAFGNTALKLFHLLSHWHYLLLQPVVSIVMSQ